MFVTNVMTLFTTILMHDFLSEKLTILTQVNKSHSNKLKRVFKRQVYVMLVYCMYFFSLYLVSIIWRRQYS